MQPWIRHWCGLIIAVVIAGCAAQPHNAEPAAGTSAATATQPAPSGINIPIDYYKLDNGLKVVLSRETTAPTVTVGVYYHIGFRIEPRGRTGFAHLFEHLMFQGSGNLGKMEFIRLVEGNGGVLNGSTRFDFTNYFQIVPAHTLESVLWAEADRMKALAITQANLVNQQGVVKNEVRDATMNQPYGGFPWLSMPQVANQNWYNAHNFYGDLADLDAATLEDAKAFFDTYYAPNNAVLVVAGDFDPASARAWIEKYFAALPARAQPARPDLTEPEQQAEKQDTYVDRLAPRPALALAWQVPDRGTPEHYAFSLLDTILLQGEDSRLWQKLVQERGYSNAVAGGINLLGNEFTYDGPMLWMLYLIHDPSASPEAIIADVDAEIARLAAEPPSPEEVDSRADEAARLALRSRGLEHALRARRPSRLFRALRRRPGAHQPPRGRFPRDIARAHPRRGAEVPDAGAPHGADRRAGRGRACPRGGGAAVKRFSLLVAGLIAFGAVAAEREQPPEPGTPHEFRLPAKETLRLDNGLAMTFIDYGSVPKVTLLAVVRTGNIDEGEDTWLPDVTVEMLKEGTTTRSAYEIARDAAGMGGALGLSVGAEQTTAGLSVLSDHAVAAVALLADVLRNPHFPESELPRVRANFERSLAVARADPLSLADEALARLVFGDDHPFGRILPREGQLAGYDIAKIRDFYERNFGARRTHVYVAGRYDRGALEAALRGAFGDWRGGPAPSERPAKPSEKLSARAGRQPRSAAILGAHGGAGARSVERPVFPDDADEQPAGRDFRLAHHEQHPRGQGLQLLARFLDQRAARRRALDHERGNHRRAYGRRDYRDLQGDRPAAARGADRGRARPGQELPLWRLRDFQLIAERRAGTARLHEPARPA